MSVSRVVAVLLLAAAGAHAEDARTVSQADVLKRIESKDAATVIVDVRTPEEYAAGHLPGAINIPYTHLPARASALAGAGDKNIVLYCQTGVRAGRAAERLREHGFTRLLHLEGDMKQWTDKKLPTEVD
jgi:rhodanese-related sulfurtransferase